PAPPSRRFQPVESPPPQRASYPQSPQASPFPLPHFDKLPHPLDNAPRAIDVSILDKEGVSPMTNNPFASLEWRNIGSHRGGRVVAVAGHPTELGTFYFGGCAGGVWRTTNGGSHWGRGPDPYF